MAIDLNKLQKNIDAISYDDEIINYFKTKQLIVSHQTQKIKNVFDKSIANNSFDKDFENFLKIIGLWKDILKQKVICLKF
jgi:hypothetical protein